MTKMEEVWYGVRTAVSYPVMRVDADTPRADMGAISPNVEAISVVRPLWFALELLDMIEFSFLSDEEQGILVDAVGRLRNVNQKLTDDARQALLELVKLFEFDRFNDPQAYRLGKLIEAAIAPERPPELAELRFRTGPDHHDVQALWIWAFISEANGHDRETYLQLAARCRRLISSASREILSEAFAYITFRSTLDLAPVEVVA